MDEMRLKYLGTSASDGIPALFCFCPVCEHARKRRGRNIRCRSGALVDDRILIDLPPDIFSQCLDHEVQLKDIQSVLVTHTHHDHFAYDELKYRRPRFAVIPEGMPPLTVYGSKAVGEKIKKLSEDKSGRVLYSEVKAFQTLDIERYLVTPLPAEHKQDETAFIYHVEKEGRSLLYAHDTGYFPEETWEWITGKKIELVSLDCTFGKQERDGEGGGHMGIETNLVVRERMLNLDAASKDAVFVIDHFSHNGGISYDDLVNEPISEYFSIAYDGMEVQVKDQ